MKRTITAAAFSMLSACTIYFGDGDGDDHDHPTRPDAASTIDAPLDAVEPPIDASPYLLDAGSDEHPCKLDAGGPGDGGSTPCD